MKKYIFLLKTQFSQVTSYRFELLTAWAYRLFEIAVFYYLWKLTTNNDEEVKRLLQYFVLYYLFFQTSSTSRLAKLINKEVHSGEVATYFVKPINFPLAKAMGLLTVIFIRVFMPTVAFVSAMIFFPEYFAPHSLSSLLWFLIFFILGLVIWNIFMIAVGSLSFWGTEIGHTLSVIDLVLNILKGAWVPAYLFSDELVLILSYTPIPYLASFAIENYQKDVEPQTIVKALVVSVFWIIILSLMSKLIYQKGIKIYEAQGG